MPAACRCAVPWCVSAARLAHYCTALGTVHYGTQVAAHEEHSLKSSLGDCRQPTLSSRFFCSAARRRASSSCFSRALRLAFLPAQAARAERRMCAQQAQRRIYPSVCQQLQSLHANECSQASSPAAHRACWPGGPVPLKASPSRPHPCLQIDRMRWVPFNQQVHGLEGWRPEHISSRTTHKQAQPVEPHQENTKRQGCRRA